MAVNAVLVFPSNFLARMLFSICCYNYSEKAVVCVAPTHTTTTTTTSTPKYSKGGFTNFFQFPGMFLLASS